LKLPLLLLGAPSVNSLPEQALISAALSTTLVRASSTDLGSNKLTVSSSMK
jgi:hypothetical protein